MFPGKNKPKFSEIRKNFWKNGRAQHCRKIILKDSFSPFSEIDFYVKNTLVVKWYRNSYQLTAGYLNFLARNVLIVSVADVRNR